MNPSVLVSKGAEVSPPGGLSSGLKNPRDFYPLHITGRPPYQSSAAVHPPRPAVSIRKDSASVPLNSAPAYFVPQKLQVVTIGAGFSGLIFAHKLRYEFPELEQIVQHTIFEARHDVGGTWLANTYPGVRCDVPSHIYSFPFEPNPEWDSVYSSGPEIEQYIKQTVTKWNLDRDIQFNSRVTRASWQEAIGKWEIRIEHNGSCRTEYAHILISAQGVLNAWNWPPIAGLQEFAGHKVHSAAWDHSYDFSQKRIAIIGNGSSAIQILPSLANLPGTKVFSFQRNPTWIIPDVNPGNILSAKADSGIAGYTQQEKDLFRAEPNELLEYRRKLHHFSHKSFRIFVKGSSENARAESVARQLMAERLGNNQALSDKLIPDWEVGCRRITPGVGYLESFRLPHVSLCQTPISHITPSAVVTTNGESYKVDAVVCATGFDVSYRPHYPIIGRRGISLADKWKDEPESYLSLACPDFPNYFIFGGPNAVIGHGSLIEALSWTATYITKWIRKIATEDIKAVQPSQSAVDQFIQYSDQIQKTLVWTGSCRSWYKNNRVDGRVTATFGGSAHLYHRMISEIRGEDFEISYNSNNKFRFMGNGFTEYELDEKNDLAFYLKG